MRWKPGPGLGLGPVTGERIRLDAARYTRRVLREIVAPASRRRERRLHLVEPVRPPVQQSLVLGEQLVERVVALL
ncbi:hypothetical protein ACWCYZ_34870 [Streptomyces virginiae]